MSDFQRVLVCRSANDLPHVPDSIGGYDCEICKEPLRLTPNGQQVLRDHPASTILCNACGLLYSQLAESQGKLERLQLNPEAKVQLDSGNNTKLAQWVRRHVR